MRRIYSSLRPPIDQKSYADWITKCDQKLSVSSKGLIAFTSSFCINQSRPNSVSYHVYVVDINTPYQPYLVVDSEHQFSIIEWDPSGTKLLVCDVRGGVIIYNSKDFLVSDWKPYFKQTFAAEQFVSGCWYHSGIMSTINVANQNLKNPSNHLEYTDKIQQSKFGASLRLFGGKAAEGCILISRTGLICCLTLMADGTVDVECESLCPLRTKIEVADISHCKDGSFVVGTSAGSINSTISFYRVQLSIKNMTLDDVDSIGEIKRVDVSCRQYNSFHLNVMSQILNERENTCAFERVNHIKFVSKDSPYDVLIEISGQNLSLIELWELEPRKKSPIHSAILEIKNISPENSIPKLESENGCSQHQQLQQQQQQPNAEQLREWVFKGNYITDKDLKTIQVPRFKIFGPNRQLNLILLAYKNSSICCLRKEDLQPIGESLDLSDDSTNRNGRSGGPDLDTKSPYKMYHPNRPNIRPSPKTPASKRAKSNYITDIQLSTNQTTFVAIDSMSQLHVVKLPSLISCQDAADEEAYLQYLLEYCLVTGNDWWDVMICAKRESIETICDKFHDAYERQPKQMQKKYFNKQLMIRASLYRCQNVASILCKSSDCHTMIMLNSIGTTLKSMLRSQDQDSPADNLSNFLKTQGVQPTFFNCNNVMSKINEKEFHVEIDQIQCLQPLNQWITELAIYLVASIPQRVKSNFNNNDGPLALPGASLTKNKEALEIIRELLIIIRIWGMQNESSLPAIYKLNEQIDVLATLFRLISVCYATLGNEQLEPQYLDECTQFTNTISMPQFSFVLPASGVASPLYFNRTKLDTHLVLEYFQRPTLMEPARLDKVEGSVNMRGNGQIDVVRNVSLGAYPVTNVRHCVRCSSVSLIRPSNNTNRVWEQRWMPTCVCGGSWAQPNKISANKVSHLVALHQQTATLNSHLSNQLVR